MAKKNYVDIEMVIHHKWLNYSLEKNKFKSPVHYIYRAYTCTAEIWKELFFHFLEKRFLSLNWDD